ADRGQLVDVADEQQVGAGGDGLDELVGQQQVQHGGLVDDDEVGVEGVVAVEGGVAAGAQLQQPVDGGGLVAGQLGQALGGAAGGGGQDDLGAFGAGQQHDRADGEALAAAGAAGEHGDLVRQRQADGLALFGGQLG